MGEKKENIKVKRELLESLIKSSKYDPYSVELFGEDEPSHKDGWGRLIIVIGEGNAKIALYKSTKPIYEEGITVDELGEGDMEIEVTHARAASSGMPVNLFSVHPAEAVSKNGYKIYVFHNGSVDKDKLVTYLGMNDKNKYVSLYPDTYFLAQYIANKIEEDFDSNIIRDMIRFTKTALNVGILMFKEDEIQILIGSFYKLINKAQQRKNYYKMYFGKINEKLFMYASSTLIDFYKRNIQVEWNEVPNGKFEVYSINYKHEPKLKLKTSYSLQNAE